MVTTPSQAPSPPSTTRSSRLARAKARAASSLWVWTRASCARAMRWPRPLSGQRMLSPPGGGVKSSGRRIAGSAGSTGIEAVLSTVSWTHFSDTQPPVKRDMAMPSRPYSRISCTPAGLRTGTSASTMAYSLWCAVVLDSQIWSSPSSSSTPPCGAVPNRLPWRIASPERSTPGPLAYQIANTPS